MFLWCFLLIIPLKVLANPWQTPYFIIKQDFTKIFDPEPKIERNRASEMLPFEMPEVMTYPDLKGPCLKTCSDYAQLIEDPSNTHTMCWNQPDCSYRRYGVSLEEAQYITDMHNFIRGRVARGEEDFGSSIGQYLPPAANMRRMVWNWELAKVAAAWGKTCAGKNGRFHDCDECRNIFSRDYNVAQNLAQHAAANLTKFAVNYNIQLWWEESFLMTDIGIIANYYKNFTVGHFLIMIAAETYEIGCSSTDYFDPASSSNYYDTLVCNYGPVGAIEGQPLYIEGITATICADGLDLDYLELCAPPPLTDPCYNE